MLIAIKTTIDLPGHSLPEENRQCSEQHPQIDLLMTPPALLEVASLKPKVGVERNCGSPAVCFCHRYLQGSSKLITARMAGDKGAVILVALAHREPP